MVRPIPQPPVGNEALFNARYVEIKALVRKRKSNWVLTTTSWEDIESQLVIHVWRKIHTYDKNRPFDRWCNTLLTNQTINILRDLSYKLQRPCISAGAAGGYCHFNTGDGTCSWTKSKTQCSQCPLFAAWQKKKEVKHNINATLSLENHTDEVHSKINDFVDVEGAQKVIHTKILAQLDRDDKRLYRMIFIRHWSLPRVGRKMGYKQTKNSKIPGYQIMCKFKARIRIMARAVIKSENLA